MKKPALLFLLFMACISQQLFSQPLSAFVNLQNQVMVWDNGAIRKIDYLRPLDVKVGRTVIPYIDNSRSFKVYYGGGMKQLNAGFTREFKVSDNLMTFMNANSLNVFDNGSVKNLSALPSNIF